MVNLKKLSPGQAARVLCLFLFIFAVKALGGSFYPVLSLFGISSVQGPLMGTLICAGFVWLFIRVLRIGSDWGEGQYHATKRQRFIGALILSTLLVAVLSTQVRTIHKVTIDKQQSDSLPTILSGLEDVRQGRSPYHPHNLGDGYHPVHYFLPGLWAGFYPFYAAGIDIRYYTILSQLISSILIIVLFLQRPAFAFPFWWCLIGTGGLLGVLLFSKVMLGTVATIHTASFGLLASLLIFGILQRKWWLAYLSVPLLFVTRETAVVFLMPLFAILFRHSLKRFFFLSVLTVAIAGPIVLYYLLDPNSDLFAGTRYYSTLIRQPGGWQSSLPFFGLGPLINYFQLAMIQPWLQVTGAVFAVVWIFRHSQISATQWLALTGLTYLPFILFVACTFHYLYIEPFWLTLFMLQSDGRVKVDG